MKKISSKISLIIMCCSCIAIVIIGTLIITEGNSLIRKDSQEKLLWMAKNHASQLSSDLEIIEDRVQEIDTYVRDTIDINRLETDALYLEEYEDVLAGFLFDFAQRRTNGVAAYCYFNPELSETPHDVYFVDGNDDKIPDRQNYIPFSYYDNTPTETDDKYWWYGAVSEKRGIWSNPYEWTLKNREVIEVISYNLPIYIDNKLIAVVGTYYHFDAMKEQIESIKVYEKGYATLYNEKLDIIINPKYTSGNRNTADNLATIENGLFNKSLDRLKYSNGGILEYNNSGNNELLAFSKLSNGWILGIIPSVDEMYAGINRLVVELIIVAVICIIVSIIVAWKMGIHIVKPILKVVDASEKIGNGDFSVYVDITTNDEIKTLANSLNIMVKNTKELREDLEKLAYYDSQTGIANKNLFEKQARELLDNFSDKFAYVIFDINKFKIINDIFGLEQGDLLLNYIAKVIVNSEQENEICARFNADSFHMIFFYTGKDTLERRLKKISDEILEYFYSSNGGYKLSIGFGVYIIEDKTSQISAMGDKAKIALSKIKGVHVPSIYFYNNDIRNKIIEEQEIENDMEAALRNNEFKLYLQPKYGVNDEIIKGAEALVRWQSPKNGLVPPDKFIPLFEKNGFIEELDMYMLENVCRLIKTWRDNDIQIIPISINQSRQYLHHLNHTSNLVSMLKKYNIPHSLIELEITETVFFNDQEKMIDIIRELHSLDFKISMDDFGSGYSSLNMLQAIPVDVLKIDKMFFVESIHSVRGRKIIENIIRMAKDLNIEIVAEGIETKEQLDFLKGTGCDLAQGYHFSKPITEFDFDKLLKTSERV